MTIRSVRAALCAAITAALVPGHALEIPREMKLLPESKTAMLCALQMTNLAILAQREPTGAADEALQHSATLYTLALAWLPHAQGVGLDEQTRLGYLVVEQSVQEQREQGDWCAGEATRMLKTMPAAQKAMASANGMTQAAKLLREVHG